ncbi:hypothetical protein CA13_18020 [Planctomycetes bacterium CA13]|uniref:Uncharacterized protein n=1 Tax=Novipirellula herctigrandis TaxID=2527986 RepID=A0A5C5Z0L1_9BACT|nr:hypothetical protein CA13_18020 [Planctomycetes bacterium CA13]
MIFTSKRFVNDCSDRSPSRTATQVFPTRRLLAKENVGRLLGRVRTMPRQYSEGQTTLPEIPAFDELVATRPASRDASPADLYDCYNQLPEGDD